MTSARRATILGFVVVLIVVVMITLSPTAIDTEHGAWVDAALAILHCVGAPDAFGYRELEMTANVVMFVPLGALLAVLLVPGRRWFGYAILPLLSAGIEMTQWLFLAGRDASVTDILTNSIGGWIGLGIVLAIIELHSRLSGHRSLNASER